MDDQEFEKFLGDIDAAGKIIADRIERHKALFSEALEIIDQVAEELYCSDPREGCCNDYETRRPEDWCPVCKAKLFIEKIKSPIRVEP